MTTPSTSSSTPGSGEKPGYREAMDRMVKDFVSHGMDPKVAVEKTKKAAQREDSARNTR